MAKHQNLLIRLLYIALALLGLWLLLRFALPWVLPFLLALLTARLIEPLVGRLTKFAHVKRGFSAAVCSVGILAVLVTVLSLLVSRLIGGASGLAQNLPEMAGQLSHTFSKLENAVYRFVIAAPVETQAMIKSAISSVSTMLSELPGQLSSSLIGLATSIASAFPKILLFSITYAISVVFMSSSYPQVIEFIMRQIPNKWHERVRTLRDDMVHTLGAWCKAQLMLMGVTFGELALALTILRVPYGILLAALIALIDALPVLGTGTVLIPWGLVCLIAGDFTLGVGLLLTYAVVSVVRSFMEPRLVGGQLGLHPVATLMAMYVGFCAIGVAGMIAFPIALIFIKQFNDRGYVRLWK